MSRHRLVLHRRPARLTAGLLALLFLFLQPSYAWSQSPAPTARSSNAYLVKDIMGSGLSGTASSNVDLLVATEGYLFFSAETGIQAETGYPNLGLWRSDGTQGGTVRLLDLTGYQVPWDSYDTTRPRAGRRWAYFIFMGSGPGVPSGDVLIRTDGRHTYNLGAFGEIGQTALAGDDTFYFIRGRSEAGYSLMRLRPQDSAPQEVWFSGPSADGYFRLYAAATQVYLIVESREAGGDPEAPLTLTTYIGDSTAPSLRRMGRLPSYSNLMTPRGEDLYFATDRLWRSNGTLTGTVPLSITTGVTLSFVGLAAAGDLLYFLQGSILDRESPMTQLWQTDGTQAGTRQVLEIPRHPQWSFLRAEGDRVTFMVALDTGPQYWWSDGTRAGSGATTLGAVHFEGDRGFILAGDEQGVQGLWTLDGTTPRLLRSFTRSPQLTPTPSWWPQGVGWRGAYYFTAADVAHGIELWRSDGTESGTVLVKDVNTTPDPMGDPTRYGPPQFLTPGETLL